LGINVASSNIGASTTTSAVNATASTIVHIKPPVAQTTNDVNIDRHAEALLLTQLKHSSDSVESGKRRRSRTHSQRSNDDPNYVVSCVCNSEEVSELMIQCDACEGIT
jgi:hypothetical protein